MSTCVGIDLGTTQSSVGIWQNERVEVVANDNGNRSTPTVVGFGEEVLVGETALSRQYKNLANTVSDSKRLIGSFQEAQLTVEKHKLNYSIEEASHAEDGEVAVTVEHLGEAKKVTPREVATIVAKELKGIAEGFSGRKVRSCVMAVPVHADDAQKRLVAKIGQKAGLKVLRIIHEPVAAALADNLDNESVTLRNVLVLNVGGATLDVTLLNVQSGIISVVGNAHDKDLGGVQVDKLVAEHLVKEFKKKTKADPTTNVRAMSRLLTEAARAKCSLSLNSQTQLQIDGFHEGHDLSTKLNRARFEGLIGSWTRHISSAITTLLASKGVEAEDVSRVLLVGGCSRIPKVRAMVGALLPDADLSDPNLLPPEEAVVMGCTIEAATITEGEAYEARVAAAAARRDGKEVAETPKEEAGDEEENTEAVDLSTEEAITVTPLSLSVEVGGVCEVVVARGEPLPATKSVEVAAAGGAKATDLFLRVFEGERALAKDNTLIASLALKGVVGGGHGAKSSVTVTLAVDEEGKLNVTLKDVTGGAEQTIEVGVDAGRLTAAKVEVAVAEAAAKAEEDKAVHATAAALLLLKEEIQSAKAVIKVAGSVAQAAGEGAKVTVAMVETSTKEVEECEAWAGKEAAVLSGVEAVEEQRTIVSDAVYRAREGEDEEDSEEEDSEEYVPVKSYAPPAGASFGADMD